MGMCRVYYSEVEHEAEESEPKPMKVEDQEAANASIVEQGIIDMCSSAKLFKVADETYGKGCTFKHISIRQTCTKMGTHSYYN